MDSGPSAGLPTDEEEAAAGGPQAPQASQPPPGRRRLWREPDDKKLAGICGGLSDYTGVDPALVRAGAVLLTALTPLTVVAYLVAIFAIDERPPSVPRVVAPPVEVLERHRWLPLVLIAAAVLTAVGGPWWWWPGLDMPLAAPILIGVGVWLLARSRSDREGGDTFRAFSPAPQTVAEGEGQMSWPSGQEPTNLSLGVDITTRNEEGGPTLGRTAGLGDAVSDDAGVGGLAPRTGFPPADEGAGPPGEFPPPSPPEWSGPQPAPVGDAAPAAAGVSEAGVSEADGRGSERLGLLVTALVLIGGGTAWFLHTADIADVDPRAAFGVGLVVVGLGLVLAAWRGRARAALIPLGLVAVLALAGGEVVDVPLDAGVGDRTVVVARRGELDRPIELLMGELVVDLRDLPLSARRPTEVQAELGIGDLRVLVPREADVVVDANVRAGDVGGELGSARGGDADGGLLLDETYELDASEGAPRLDLTLDVGLGQLEVVRG